MTCEFQAPSGLQPGTDVKEGFKVVLLYDQGEPVAGLEPELTRLGLRCVRARTCAEAAQLLAAAQAPHLLFCDTVLPDGTWADALQLAARAPALVKVIVVARFVNIRFYVEVIERGAFDFVAPPFVSSDLLHIVRCATANTLGHRAAPARTA
jgi:DNA-binding NtrC family response regulator